MSILARLFGPALRLIWQDRASLRRAVWLRARHPKRWAQARDELGSDG